MPRIIAGSAKRIMLASPRGRKTRPTADRVKEALFSILAPHMPAAGFLDLYAGTGQIGLEAASRGSENVILVEKDISCLKCLRENLQRTGLERQVKIIAGDVRASSRKLLQDDVRFAVIYLDPPYRQAIDHFCQLAETLGQLLVRDGVLILEHEKIDMSPPNVMNLQLSRRCQYSSTMLSFYYHQNGEKAVRL